MMISKKSEKEIMVIPAQAGIQYVYVLSISWIPVFTGMTTFYDSIILQFAFYNLYFAMKRLLDRQYPHLRFNRSHLSVSVADLACHL